MQIRPWPFVEMSKQPDTFIYGTIHLQPVIQKEYCLEIFHGPKVEVTHFPVESMTLHQDATNNGNRGMKKCRDHGILFLGYAHTHW